MGYTGLIALWGGLSGAFAAPGDVDFEPLDAERPIAGVDSVYLPDLTWMEVRDARDAGARTVIVPTGGIEQNGPFLALKKHDVIVREVAERTARSLGDALVAPVVSFVPEGRAGVGHMAYPGTLSLRDETFEALLADVVRSYASHGFEHIVLVGDSGGNQDGQAAVAEALDGSGVRVHHIPAFYDPAADNAFLEERGLTWTADVYHDEPSFTLQLAAIDPEAARLEQRRAAGLLETDGFILDEAALSLGEALLDRRAAVTAEAIHVARATPPPSAWSGVRDAVFAPFLALANPGERIFGVYLLTALVIALFAEAWRQGRDWSLGSVGRALFPRKVWGSNDARQDLLFVLFGGAFAFAWFGGGWTALINLGRDAATAVLSLTGIANLDLEPTLLLALVTTLVLALVTDFATFLAHYLQHRIPILWAFHKVHHAARELTPLTLFRQHPVDLLLAGVFGSLLGGAITGTLEWLTAEPPTQMQFYGLNAIVFAFYVVGYNLRHSHVWVSFGPLERIFVSPAMHQIHHSEAERHWDRNMGLVFSFWDQLFGTAYIPKEREELTFGIGRESERFTHWTDFWVEPFRELLGMDIDVPEPESEAADPGVSVNGPPDHADGRVPSPRPSRLGSL
jgi:sterol desaturase/sphingolipid hydroxylase (fatty acid hydroxylase superfamily)/creatinine amidohydrolase/Fe(II)-dependent formamide hydrolase-like protein